MNDRSVQTESVSSNQPGYLPLLFSAGWQVAVLNWEPALDPANLREIERHGHTDEVFLLWHGQAMLYTHTGEDFQFTEMLPGVAYNVPAAIWHSLIATRDASLWIVENRDTHLFDTEIRPMTPEECAEIRESFPIWAKRK